MTLHIMFDSSHMGDIWDWLEIIAWSMMDEELWYDLHRGITLLSIMDFWDDVIYTGAHTAHWWEIFWDDAL